MMTLGAAQLGMAYGINGLSERPDTDACRKILTTSWQLGVRSLDTASSYGESESQIGHFMRENPQCRFELTTKLSGQVDPTSRLSVRESVEQSFERLSAPIRFLLLHNASHMVHWSMGLGDELRACKTRGLVQSFGVSVYDTSEFEAALETPELEAIQVPMNVFDQRLIRDNRDLLERAETAGVNIFVRSVFLQGLLLMSTDDVKKKQPRALPWIEKWIAICKDLGREPADAALNFVRAVLPQANLVLGCDSADQVMANTKLFASAPLSAHELTKIYELSLVPGEIYDPRKWERL